MTGISIGLGGTYAAALACRGCIADQGLADIAAALSAWMGQ
jgi:hypothetical protein